MNNNTHVQENQGHSPSNPIVIESEKTSSLLPLFGGVAILLLGVGVGVGGYQWWLQNRVVSEVSQNGEEQTVVPASSTFVTLNESTFASYPLVNKDGQLFFIPISPGIGSFSPNLQAAWGSGAYGLGTSDPTVSPDNQKIALIEAETSNLLLVTADGKQQVRVSNQIPVSYISGWSPDSKKLVVYANSPTIESLFVPEGPVPEDAIPLIQQLPSNNSATGYYLVDLEKQEIKHLPYFNGLAFITWVDANKVLLNLEENGGKKYVVFDFTNQEANSELLKGVLDPYFGEQISFNREGTIWAITLSPTSLLNASNSQSSIVLAPFPSIAGEVISTGQFAQVQQPIISPTGDKVVFQGYDVVNGPNFVYYFDGVETHKLFEGLPRKWVNNDSFIYAVSSEVGATNPSLTSRVFIYDTVKKESVQLFGN